MRKVSLKQLQDATASPADAANLAQMLGSIGKSVEDMQVLAVRVNKLEEARVAMTKALDTIQKQHVELSKALEKLMQYTKDHDKLHADMAAASGNSQKELMKLVRNTIAQTDIVQTAVKELVANRQIPIVVDVKAPPVNVEVAVPNVEPAEVKPERGAWNYKINYGKSGRPTDIDVTPK